MTDETEPIPPSELEVGQVSTEAVPGDATDYDFISVATLIVSVEDDDGRMYRETYTHESTERVD